jgi:hypothetical protein
MNPTDPIANLLSQASMRLPEATEIEVVHHTSVPMMPKGDIGLADCSRVNQYPSHVKRTRKRSPTPVNQNLRCGKCSEQLQLNSNHQVLVVLTIMIMLNQQSILPSSSIFESLERNRTVHLEIQ